jgi:hypothetical protein
MSKIIITIDIPDGAAVGTTTSSGPSSTRPSGEAPQDIASQGSQSDPWSSPSGGSGNAAASRTEPSGGNSAPADSNVKVVSTKNGDQTWTLHAPNAPMCHCDIPAAHVEGNGKNNKTWKAWRCTKGSGDNWRDKCDFSEWA